jgi:hypothetical protein
MRRDLPLAKFGSQCPSTPSETTMRAFLITAGLIVPAAFTTAGAAAEPLGEHPALVARRVAAAQGYDYASKFYPHPAWLYLLSEAPRPMSDHPAVIVARREQARLALTHEPAAALAQR